MDNKAGIGIDQVRKPYEDMRLVWGKDKTDGGARYIFELSARQNGDDCNCICYSCGSPLQAVNAGKSQFVKQPHFRHIKGSIRSKCLLHAARVAALRFLLSEGTLQLPKRRRHGSATGVSGQTYEAFVEQPPELVKITSYVETYDGDTVKAILKLEDGREVAIMLLATLDVVPDCATDQLRPTIQILVSDPAIATMSWDELKARVEIVLDEAQWCQHWDDQKLKAAADELALRKAQDALDWLDIIDDLPSDCDRFLKQETILHIKAKEILQNEKHLVVPELLVRVSSSTQAGLECSKSKIFPSEDVHLSEVFLERNIGQIRPDVIALADRASGLVDNELLIEITVTNHITEERLARIRALNKPTIEIDLSCMSGEISVATFTDLLINRVEGKLWLHHPLVLETENSLTIELDTEIASINAECERKAAEDAAIEQAQRAEAEAERNRLREVEARHKHELDEYVARLVILDNQKLGVHYLQVVADFARYLLRNPDRDKRHEWEVNRNALQNRIYAAADELITRGFHSAKNSELFTGLGAIIPILLSFQRCEPIGYNFDSLSHMVQWLSQQKDAAYSQWSTLYLMALRVYRPTLNVVSYDMLMDWRKKVARRIDECDIKYLRWTKHDELIGLLFPEMSELLKHPAGKRGLQEVKAEVPRVNELDEKAEEDILGFIEKNAWHTAKYRLECIKANQWIGHTEGGKPGPAWRVIAEVIYSKPEDYDWWIVYIQAIDHFKPKMNPSQFSEYLGWKQNALTNESARSGFVRTKALFGDSILELCHGLTLP